MADLKLYEYFTVRYTLRGVAERLQRTYRTAEPTSANQAVIEALGAFLNRPTGADWLPLDGGGFVRVDDVVSVHVQPSESLTRGIKPAQGRLAQPLPDVGEAFESYPD